MQPDMPADAAAPRFLARLCTAGVVALVLSGCAAAPKAMSIPRGEPVRLLFAQDPVNLQVVITPPGGGTSVVTKLIADSIDDANRSNTSRLKDEVKARERGEPLARLFAAEVRSRVIAKGGKLATGSENRDVPTITLDNLTAMYLATTFASNYEPIALVYVSASTDPANIGNRPGATVRHLEARLSRPDVAFPSSDAIFSKPSQAYAGLRAAVVELAERVAVAIVAAQEAGKSR